MQINIKKKNSVIDEIENWLKMNTGHERNCAMSLAPRNCLIQLPLKIILLTGRRQTWAMCRCPAYWPRPKAKTLLSLLLNHRRPYCKSSSSKYSITRQSNATKLGLVVN